MATTITKYTSYKQYVHDGTINLNSTGKIMLALVLSTYTPSTAHTVWADVSADEAANGDGYTTGGEALGSLSVNSTRFDAADVTWSSLTKTFRYGVLYINDTVNAIVNPLIAYILFDDTPADISIGGGDFTVQWSNSGIIIFS
jgi:hypothetical protein